MQGKKKSVAIIGGGAAGIICGCKLDSSLYDITIFEKTSRLGRKLLVAGEGGFNLTYHESIENLTKRYSPAGFFDTALHFFDSTELRNWLADLDIPTYVGTSNRVFPEKGIKPYQVVDKMLLKLEQNVKAIVINAEWKGWKDDEIIIEKESLDRSYSFDIVILALGGRSWSKTGSNGAWKSILLKENIKCISFKPSNCGWKVKWDKELLDKIEGKPLKNISITVAGQRTRGEALVTKYGLEGGAIYAQAGNIRQQIASIGNCELYIDFKPNIELDALIKRLQSRSKSIKYTLINELKLSAVSFAMVYSSLSKEAYQNTESLAQAIKSLKLVTTESEGIEKAISTVGGINLEEIDENFRLVKKGETYVIGEMLDWDTRTGGYLLQACFSMGSYVANVLNQPNQHQYLK